MAMGNERQAEGGYHAENAAGKARGRDSRRGGVPAGDRGEALYSATTAMATMAVTSP